MNKYFIITAGPTGSGKTNLVISTFRFLGIPLESKYTKILIDDLVENSKRYKGDVKAIIEKVKDNCHPYSGVNNDCFQNAFENPTEELFEEFNTAYQNAKKTPPCDTSYVIPSEFASKNNILSCSDLLDDLIENLTKTKPDIVVFETTGRTIPTWLLEEKFIPKDYKIILSYSMVSIPNLVIRNKKRAYDSVKMFDNDFDHPAPRLPDVSEKTFTTVVREIKNSLKEIYEKCIQPQELNPICGKRKIDRLLIFDNNETQVLVFDSNSQIFTPVKIGGKSKGRKAIKRRRSLRRKR